MNIALIAAGTLVSKKEATWLTMFNLASEYKNQGHSVVIVAKRHPSLPAIETLGGITVYRLYGQGKLNKLTAVSKTIQHIQREQKIKFDILHGFSSSPLLSLELKLAQKHAPQATIIHTLKSYSKYPSMDNLSFLLRYADVITVPTSIAAVKIPERFRKKIAIIRSNIDINKFKPRNKQLLRQKHGFENKTLILNYGALRWEKGIDDLIKAIPLVLKEFPDALFFFAVRSKEMAAREKYLAMAKELGCGSHISIVLDDVPIEEYVSMADAVVLAYPTLQGTEGNPSCLLESMAAKTPVVTTPLLELQEIVQHEKEVLMAGPSDPRSVAENIIRILKEKGLRETLVENAFVKSHEFDTKKIAEMFLKIYSVRSVEKHPDKP